MVGIPQPIVGAFQLTSPTSVEKPIEVSLERIGDVAPAPREATRRDDRWPAVAQALRGLPPLERRVLVLSYGRGLTLREIGLEIGLSESGVCRLRARALARVRSVCAS